MCIQDTVDFSKSVKWHSDRFDRPRKDLCNKLLQIDCSFEYFFMKSVFEMMFRWCLTYDDVYIYGICMPLIALNQYLIAHPSIGYDPDLKPNFNWLGPQLFRLLLGSPELNS